MISREWNDTFNFIYKRTFISIERKNRNETNRISSNYKYLNAQTDKNNEWLTLQKQTENNIKLQDRYFNCILTKECL